MVSPKGHYTTTISCTTRKMISGKIEKRVQLSVLCGVGAYLIFLPARDNLHKNQPITWPKNENCLRSVVDRYQSYAKEGKTNKKNQKKGRADQESSLSSECSHTSVSSDIIESHAGGGGGSIDFDLHFGSPEEVLQANQGLVQSGCANQPACSNFCDDYVDDYEQKMAVV